MYFNYSLRGTDFSLIENDKRKIFKSKFYFLEKYIAFEFYVLIYIRKHGFI